MSLEEGTQLGDYRILARIGTGAYGEVYEVEHVITRRRDVIKVLVDGRLHIAEGIAEREQIRSDLEQTEAERRRIVQQADAKATQIIEEAHAAAARLLDKETRKAVGAAEQLVAKAQQAALQEHDRMLADLKLEIGTLVVQATATVTRKVLTPEDQRRMAEDTITQLGRAA